MEHVIPFIRIYIEEIKQISRSIELLKSEKVESLHLLEKADSEVSECKINILNNCLIKLEEAINILNKYHEKDLK